MMPKTMKLLVPAALLLASIATGAQALTLYTIKIEDSFIRATANDDVIEIRLAGDDLVVSTLPVHGFYGLQVGDRIVKVNGIAPHTTQDFLDDLDKSGNQVADFEVLRNGKTLVVPVPRKGYSIFL
jgi:hypothetical protein